MQKSVLSFTNRDNGAVSVIAMFASADDAHTSAEALSYAVNRNSIYGLFGYAITPLAVFLSQEDGRAAYNEFMG